MTPVGLELTSAEQAVLDGSEGEGASSALRIVVRLARAMGASRLRSISSAHIDSCLYHGRSGIDFVARLAAGGARVQVPTTLNVSSLDLLHPELYRGDDSTRRAARTLMDGYVALGCEPTWTCAPYQRESRPVLGEHVAWAESNAIVFANSVLGARTHRYGDFVDIAAAITARVPDAGLHQSAQRRATTVFDVGEVPPALLADDAAYPVIGFLVGRGSGAGVPAITGLPGTVTEDQLKALGAAAASSGGIGMFHAIGVTPEAPTLEAACQNRVPEQRTTLSLADCRSARDSLSTAHGSDPGTPIATVNLGTPHYSIREIGALVELLGDRSISPNVKLYVNTGREVLAEASLRGWVASLEGAGVTFVTDTCTYITPILSDTSGLAMTDSGKWAYYAPGNLGVDVVFASAAECVESAVAGKVVRDDHLWGDR